MHTPLTWAIAPVLALSAVCAQNFDAEAMEAFASELFDRMDLDADGTLTEEEHERAHGGGFMVDYRLLDLNGDGSVTKAEYLGAVRKYHSTGSSHEAI